MNVLLFFIGMAIIAFLTPAMADDIIGQINSGTAAVDSIQTLLEHLALLLTTATSMASHAAALLPIPNSGGGAIIHAIAGNYGNASNSQS